MRENPVVSIRTAEKSDVEAVSALFDLYRQFYHQPADPEKCRRYIGDRMRRSESVVFLALDEKSDKALGFTQLYWTFCSVAAASVVVLYDLFVIHDARGLGIGGRLMESAREYAQATGACRIDLQTHHTNVGAQRLYESLGYKRDTDFYNYSLTL